VCSFLLGVISVPMAAGAQGPRRQAPVEVTTPKAPAPILADGTQLLGYELHITNFDSHPLQLLSKYFRAWWPRARLRR
jgi:hypothetical protein